MHAGQNFLIYIKFCPVLYYPACALNLYYNNYYHESKAGALTCAGGAASRPEMS